MKGIRKRSISLYILLHRVNPVDYPWRFLEVPRMIGLNHLIKSLFQFSIHTIWLVRSIIFKLTHLIISCIIIKIFPKSSTRFVAHPTTLLIKSLNLTHVVTKWICIRNQLFNKKNKCTNLGAQHNCKYESEAKKTKGSKVWISQCMKVVKWGQILSCHQLTN